MMIEKVSQRLASANQEKTRLKLVTVTCGLVSEKHHLQIVLLVSSRPPAVSGTDQCLDVKEEHAYRSMTTPI